jgi:hypothetical protein
LAGERADYLQRKISVKEERIRDIERAYQVKNMASKIFVSKPHTHPLKRHKDEALDMPIDFVD